MTRSAQDYFRRGARTAQTVPIFTNRGSERAAFDAKLADHARWKATLDPLDVDAARENVIVFHGVGGIGKSSLLRALQREFDAQAGARASLVVDFQEPTAFDVEDLLLRLRATVGRLGIRCVAFDFALSYYWSVVHPGLSLQTYTQNSSILRRLSDKVGLSDQVEASVVEVLSAVLSASQVAHGVARLTQAVSKITTERVKVRHVIGNCDALPYFLESAAIENELPFLAALLAWDLHQAGNPPVAFFFDTWEEVTGRGRPIERDLQRICYLLPNALFIIAGRNRLDWAAEGLRGTLDYVGNDSWPNLERTGRHGRYDQYLIGDLSDLDADIYLSQRLVSDGGAAIPADIRRVMVDAAKGWPLYLEVAASHYQEALQAGAVDTTDFGAPFPALVTRLASDMSTEERHIMRAAALLTSFDEELLHAASGVVSRGVVHRFVERAFVKESVSTSWPYSLHAALREAVLGETAGPDSWTPHDWTAAAGRTLEELGRRAAAPRTRTELAACVEEGLHLSHRYAIAPPWLSTACVALARANGLESIHGVPEASSPAGALSQLLAAIANHPRLPAARQETELEIRITGSLSKADLFWARSLQASARLSAGDIDGAESLYRRLLTDPPNSPVLRDTRTMYALTLLKRGLFRELDHYVRQNPDQVNEHRLRGDVYRLNARWSYAEGLYRAGLERAGEDDLGLAALFRAELALIDGWTGQDNPTSWREAGDFEFGCWTEVSQLIAEGLFFVTRDTARCIELLSLADEVAARFGLQEGSADVTVARGFAAAVLGEEDVLNRCIEKLAAWVASSGTYRSWLAVLRLWQGTATLGSDSTVQWIGSSTSAEEAWSRTLERRRAGP